MKELLKRIALITVPLLLIFALFRLLSPALKSDVSFSQAIYDRSEKLIRLTLSRDDKYRLWLPLKSISPILIKATLLHEDKWFRFHPGVSPTSLGRAIWHTYIKKDRKIGGSTITMQLARIKYDINSRTISGKTAQILAAFWLELLYSKNDILEAYLNLVPYGRNIEGAGAASIIYFHKNADRLTLTDALTLSVIPQSPAKRMGNRGENGITAYQSLEQARKVLLAKWVSKYPIDKDQKSFVDLPIMLKRPSDLPFLAPHFANEVRELDPFDPVLNTTLDLRLQKLIERHVKNYVEANKQKGINNAVVLLVDHRTLEVKSLIGSADFFDKKIDGQVNGTRAKRSPGSALKPFIYGLGIDQGLIHPMTMLKDAPMSFGAYNPENFDNEFAGPIKAKDALVKSRNVPAVDIASRLASPGLHGFLLKAGITRMRDESFYGMSLALGSAEISMEELVQLYAMLVNGGELKQLRFLKSQREEDGTRLLSTEASYLVHDILSANPNPLQGFRTDWIRDHLPVSWKTGTSFGFRDAWSVGIVGPYVLAVWIGNFDGEGNPSFIGREAAAPLFFEIIDSLKSEDPGINEFRGKGLADLDLTKVEVCSLSGGLPGPDCKQRVSTWFIPGKSPIAKCDVHRRISINNRTGLRACIDNGPGTRSEVYEFWQSDLIAIFQQAGIPRRMPPPYEARCNSEELSTRGSGPQITSPRVGVVYSLRAGSLKDERLPLMAVTDADTKTIHWFVSEEYLGSSDSGKTFFWTPKTGRFVVRAVDDHGRSAVREVVTKIVE
ncbi:MAG: penicillin-binding protein 1C [Nitrospirae bacterium GWC2_56_14]|nr:MAG: penicillin-binding protein 1C [Nitrospirae bacterium GWC2_56_14]